MGYDLRGKVRDRDRFESFEAASLQTDARIGGVQRGILAVLALRPMTDPEIAGAYRELARHDTSLPPASDSGLRTRRSELNHAGHVYPTGQRRRTPSGAQATVWASRTSHKSAPEEFELFRGE